jgi:hypothetical protein
MGRNQASAVVKYWKNGILKIVLLECVSIQLAQKQASK